MVETFKDYTRNLESPAKDLANVSRALNVSGDGSVRITTLGGSTTTAYIAADITFPVRATRVWQTGASATGIVAMW